MLATVVLLLHCAAPDSEALAIQIQPELDAVFARSPVRAEIRIDSRSNNLGTPDEAVYVELKNSCRPKFTGTAGPLARTQSVDGVIVPLIEIDCAKVATFIRSTAALPRALARVLAHELLHYLLQERGHARTGIFQATLTAFQLTDPAPPVVNPELLLPAKLARSY